MNRRWHAELHWHTPPRQRAGRLRSCDVAIATSSCDVCVHWSPIALQHHFAVSALVDAPASGALLLEMLAASWPRLALHALHTPTGSLVVVELVVRVIIRAGWHCQCAPFVLAEAVQCRTGNGMAFLRTPIENVQSLSRTSTLRPMAKGFVKESRRSRGFGSVAIYARSVSPGCWI